MAYPEERFTHIPAETNHNRQLAAAKSDQSPTRPAVRAMLDRHPCGDLGDSVSRINRTLYKHTSLNCYYTYIASKSEADGPRRCHFHSY